MLVGLVVLMGVAKALWPDVVPVSILAIPAIIGGWRLSLRSLGILSVVILVVLAVEVWVSPGARTIWAAVVVVLIVGLGFRYATLRQRWGLSATKGMPILLELRDRVRELGEPPELDAGWVLSRALRSAGDEAFRGDFTLAQRDGSQVQAMVVDVSGHGLLVAGRATQLAGAFGGLIQVLPAERTLEACNDYVVRQQWDRDYATAVHVVLDQASGSGRALCAGHPPPQVRRADGRWHELAVRGRVLGLSKGARFEPTQFRLEPGDSVVLVSDGALDEATADPWNGVHAAVERWLADGARMGTHPLRPLSTVVDDDQTIVALHRRPELDKH